MQEISQTITTEWTPLSSLITVDASKTYYIQNRGTGILVLAEGNSEPEDEGTYVDNLKIAEYKKGSQNLYLKGHSRNINVNITSEG